MGVGRFNVRELPTGVVSVEVSVKQSLPLLPQASVALRTWRYRDARKTKRIGKGTETEELDFIMTLPWMQRDVRNSRFIGMMQCTYIWYERSTMHLRPQR